MQGVKMYLLAYIATGAVFLAGDAVWLSVMGKALYRPLLGGLLLKDFSLVPAILFYVIYIVGILVFAVMPAIASGSWTVALTHGALFGLCAYATYDLTNQATLKDWPLAITIADLCWGTFLTASSAALGYFITRTAAKALNL